MRRKLVLSTFILLAIFVDQIVKYAVVENIGLGEVKSFLPGLMSLTYLQNTGAAFSILENQQWFFFLVTLIVVGGAVWYLFKNSRANAWMLTGLVLIISGGLGNFIDRLRQGFVVDMFQLDFINFAIFNVADAYLTVGVIILLLFMLMEERIGSKN